MEVASKNVSKHLKNFESYNTSTFGPDCIISSSNEPNLDVLNKVDYYWFVSQNNGCVECIVNKSGQKPKTTNPNCVITRKHRRIEAYCCMVCKSSFITVTQALIHFKTMHRPNKKIYIQNQDMQDVPPPPFIAKSSLQLRKTHSASVLRNCISNNVHAAEPEPSTKLSPKKNPHSTKVKVETESCVEDANEEKKSPTSQVNSPQCVDVDCNELSIEISQACLAMLDAFTSKQHLVSALKFADDNSTVTALQIDQSSITALSPQTKCSNHRASFEYKDGQTVKFDLIKLEHSVLLDATKEDGVEYKLIANDAQLACSLLLSLAGKTVSFTDLKGGGKITEPEKEDSESITQKDILPVVENVTRSLSEDQQKKHVIKETPSASNRDVTITDKYEHNDVTKAPLLSSVSFPLLQPSSPANSSSKLNPESNQQLYRVQSWGSGNFASASPSAMVRPYTARAFTYAEKIEMMKQQNDYDTEFVAKHLHGALHNSSNQQQAASSVNSNDHDNSTASPTNTGPVSNTSSAMTSQYQQITANQSKMIFQQAMANMAQHKSPNPVASPNSNASFDKESVAAASNATLSSSGSRQNKKKKASRTSSGESVNLNGSLAAQTPVIKQEKNHSETASRKSSPQNNHNHMNGNTTPAVSATLQAPLPNVLQIQNQSSMFPSTSDYYGQGEWASTAMATLLQQVQQQKQKTPPLSMLPFAGFPLLAAGTPRIPTPSEQSQQQMLYEALNSMQMARHANQIQMESANQQAALLQAALHTNVHNKKDEQQYTKVKQNGSNRSSKLKRSRSTKSDMHYHRNGSAESAEAKRHKTSPHFHPSKNATTPPLPINSSHQQKLQQQLSFDQQKEKLTSRLTDNRGFSAPVINGDDSSAKKSSSNSSTNSKKVAVAKNGKNGLAATNKTPEVVDKKAGLILSKGDQLVVVGDVANASFHSNNEVLLTLNEEFGSFKSKNNQQNKSSEKDLSNKTEMEKLFSKCVQTEVKCKIVEKTRMCKVCGFKVTVNSSSVPNQSDVQDLNQNVDREFMNHVMGHSLNDIMKSGL